MKTTRGIRLVVLVREDKERSSIPAENPLGVDSIGRGAERIHRAADASIDDL